MVFLPPLYQDDDRFVVLLVMVVFQGDFFGEVSALFDIAVPVETSGLFYDAYDASMTTL